MVINIKGRTVGKDSPVFIIAEISANHLNNFDLTVDTIKAINDSGADAVKIQTYKPENITLDCNHPIFEINQDSPWKGMNLYQLYQKAAMDWEWQPKLKKFAEKLGLIFFSSPFDKNAVDFLNDMDVPAYKIASFEITDIPLIEYVASKGKPILISTGIADLCDIKRAVNACKNVGNDQIALLKCTSSYPAPLEEINLKTINNMAVTFGTVTGLSDHTIGSTVPIAATALGAKIIEKHFILDRSLEGPDASFSMEPQEFSHMVTAIRDVEKATGRISYDLTAKTEKNRIFARSLFVVKNLKKNDIFTENNIRSIRPGYGLHPRFLDYILGKKAKKDISMGTPLDWDLIC